MLSALISCLFFTSCGFLIRHFMAHEEAKRSASREKYIDELQEDIGALVRIVAYQGAQIDALRDESSDIIHESDMLREAVGALKRINTLLLMPKPEVKETKIKTGKRVRILK